MHQFILTLGILLLAVSCGDPHRLAPLENNIYVTTYSNTPLFLKLQNSSCKNSFSSGTNIFFDLHLFLVGKDSVRNENFSDLLTDNYLKNGNVISQTVYGEEVETFLDKAFLKEAAKELKLCPDESEYFPNTIESAALNASFYINKTHNNFTEVIKNIKVSPVTLNISPSILRSTLSVNNQGETIKQSAYMTDNAFYMPSTHSIVFLPHSQDVRNSFLNVNFWEVPMVASHEYGHHLFEMINKTEEISSLNRIHTCFGEQERQSKNFKNLARRQVKVKDVINAYNEGFADLISFYTLDPEERNIKGVNCLQLTRDINSSVLVNGRSKVFSNEVLGSFFSSFDTSAFSSCENPSFQEVHVMGAIFAYNVNHFLNHFTDSNEEKLKIIVKWAKTLKKESNKTHHARSFLKTTMTNFVTLTLENFGKKLTPKTCESLVDFYPELNLTECINFN